VPGSQKTRGSTHQPPHRPQRHRRRRHRRRRRQQRWRPQPRSGWPRRCRGTRGVCSEGVRCERGLQSTEGAARWEAAFKGGETHVVSSLTALLMSLDVTHDHKRRPKSFRKFYRLYPWHWQEASTHAARNAGRHGLHLPPLCAPARGECAPAGGIFVAEPPRAPRGGHARDWRPAGLCGQELGRGGGDRVLWRVPHPARGRGA
jgi:hypothetical protein